MISVRIDLAVTEAQMKQRIYGQNICSKGLVVAGEPLFEFLQKNLHFRLKVRENHRHVHLQG